MSPKAYAKNTIIIILDSDGEMDSDEEVVSYNSPPVSSQIVVEVTDDEDPDENPILMDLDDPVTDASDDIDGYDSDCSYHTARSSFLDTYEGSVSSLSIPKVKDSQTRFNERWSIQKNDNLSSTSSQNQLVSRPAESIDFRSQQVATHPAQVLDNYSCTSTGKRHGHRIIHRRRYARRITSNVDKRKKSIPNLQVRQPLVNQFYLIDKGKDIQDISVKTVPDQKLIISSTGIIFWPYQSVLKSLGIRSIYGERVFMSSRERSKVTFGCLCNAEGRGGICNDTACEDTHFEEYKRAFADQQVVL